MNSMFLRSVLVACGVVLLAGPAHASPLSSITFDEGFAIGQVRLTWSGAFPDAFTSFALSSNCTATAGTTANAGAANCTETAPIVFTLDGAGSPPPPLGATTENINLWDGAIGGVLSDTLSIVGTQLTPTTVERVLTFRSADGGLPLVPLGLAPGVLLINEVELGLFPVSVIACEECDLNPVNVSINFADASVPEPGSLLLLGSGLVLARRRWRQHWRS